MKTTTTTKYQNLHEVRSAITAESARAEIYRQAIISELDRAKAEAEQLETALDPTLGMIHAAGKWASLIAGLTTTLSEFDRWDCENRGRILANALCAANRETICDLLEAKLATFEKSVPGRFEKWGGMIADLSRKAIGRNPDPEAVRLEEMEAGKIQGEADALNYALAAAKCGIQNFRANPTRELFEAAAAALASADAS